MKYKWFPWIFLAPFAIAFFVFLGGWVVAWLWNALLPPLFGLPVVTFWQALGILALSRILFGGFSGSSGGRHKGSHSYSKSFRDGPRAPFTPEERERIREGLRAAAAERRAGGEGDEDE